MKVTYRVLDTTKAGSQRSEMEDSSCPTHDAQVEAQAFTCAIGDGATQGSHSGPWSKALCEEFVRSGGELPAEGLEPVVSAARASFQAWEKQYLADRATQGRVLQWFEEEVMTSGAYSTLVGLRLEARATGASFHAVAVGDSCLFVIRGGALSASFPLTTSEQFAGAPLLIASAPAANGRMADGLKQLRGELAPGDGIILCTDALAAWFLRETESGVSPAARLIGLLGTGSRDAFDQFMSELRQAKAIRNDDVTLAYVLLEA